MGQAKLDCVLAAFARPRPMTVSKSFSMTAFLNCCIVMRSYSLELFAVYFSLWLQLPLYSRNCTTRVLKLWVVDKQQTWIIQKTKLYLTVYFVVSVKLISKFFELVRGFYLARA